VLADEFSPFVRRAGKMSGKNHDRYKRKSRTSQRFPGGQRLQADAVQLSRNLMAQFHRYAQIRNHSKTHLLPSELLDLRHADVALAGGSRRARPPQAHV